MAELTLPFSRENEEKSSPSFEAGAKPHDKDFVDLYKSNKVLLTFLRQDIEDKFLLYYASTMDVRRWVYLIFILWGIFILLMSINTYDLIYNVGTTEYIVASLACEATLYYFEYVSL